MSTPRLLAIALATTLPLAGCGRSPPAAAPDATAPSTLLGSKVQHAIDKAKAELATKNIDIDGVAIQVNGRNIGHRPGVPRAAITPQGELLIEGKPVAASPEQRALLLDYRGQLLGIAAAGMDIGVQGADLGMQAAGKALKAVLAGNSDDEIEKRVEARTGGIKAAAKQLCARLPALRASQQRLAAALPAFEPYANLQQRDVDDCAKDIDDKNVAGFSDQDRAEVQQAIRDSIRAAVRGGAQAVAGQATTQDQ